MNDPPLYGLCELARELNIPESTARYYRDVFASHVPSVGKGRKRRYPDEAVAVLRFIAQAFATGYTREEINTALSNGQSDQATGIAAVGIPSGNLEPPPPSSHMMTAVLEDASEQRELMWQMIKEISRFGDAIERQHYILSELVEHVFHAADRRLPAGAGEDELEGVIDADIVATSDEEEPSTPDEAPTELDALRRALEAERLLVQKLQESRLSLERRAAAAEEELEADSDRQAGVFRRLFDRNRSRQVHQ